MGSAQYSLARLLGVWASLTSAMVVLALCVAPVVTAHTPRHSGLAQWVLTVVEMTW
jgi:hypothetical protein